MQVIQPIDMSVPYEDLYWGMDKGLPVLVKEDLCPTKPCYDRQWTIDFDRINTNKKFQYWMCSNIALGNCAMIKGPVKGA